MKKFFGILLACALLCCSFGCGGETAAVQIYVPDGAPALAVANVMTDKQVDGRAVQVHVVAPAVIQSKLTNGEADLAIAPTNMGAALFNKEIPVRMLFANTYGLLYLVGKESVEYEGLDSLKGKVVHVIGQGQTPDLVLRYVLEQAGIAFEESENAVADKVAISYAADGPTLIRSFVANQAEIGVLGEPAATNAIGNAKAGVKELCDLQEAFRAASGSETKGYPQASLFATERFLDENADFVGAFLRKMEENLLRLSEDPAKAAEVLASEEYGGSEMTLTAEIVARMNLRVVPAAEAKADVETYLGILGIKAPTDGFYWTE